VLREQEAVEGDADQRDHRRPQRLDRREQPARAALLLGAVELAGGAGRARAQVGERVTPRGQPVILLGGEPHRGEPGVVEQPPERVGLAREVVADLAGAPARVDPDEEDPRRGADDVGEAAHAASLDHQMPAARGVGSWIQRQPWSR
jgi:hypothetical protein